MIKKIKLKSIEEIKKLVVDSFLLEIIEEESGILPMYASSPSLLKGKIIMIGKSNLSHEINNLSTNIDKLSDNVQKLSNNICKMSENNKKCDANLSKEEELKKQQELETLKANIPFQYEINQSVLFEANDIIELSFANMDSKNNKKKYYIAPRKNIILICKD